MNNPNSVVFIDSNFFIALYNPADSLHDKAKKIARQLQTDNLRVIISNFVFLEVVTVLSQRVSKAHARRAGKKLLQSNFFIIIDKSLQQRSWEIFEKIENKNISFVDCSTVAIMEYEDTRLLLSFDIKDFKTLQKFYKFSFYNN